MCSTQDWQDLGRVATAEVTPQSGATLSGWDIPPQQHQFSNTGWQHQAGHINYDNKAVYTRHDKSRQESQEVRTLGRQTVPSNPQPSSRPLQKMQRSAQHTSLHTSLTPEPGHLPSKAGRPRTRSDVSLQRSYVSTWHLLETLSGFILLIRILYTLKRRISRQRFRRKAS